MMGGMAKRSAAMLSHASMPAPDFVGLGHGTQRNPRSAAATSSADIWHAAQIEVTMGGMGKR